MKRFLTLLFLMAAALSTMAQEAKVFDLWPDGPLTKSKDRTDSARIHVYLPDSKKATGRAVVVCPGGAYRFLAIDHEGKHWAKFFNKLGIATIVLEYRMPHGDYRIPIEDAEAAIRLVRNMAPSWHINTNDIGIMGSSAGGHLAATIATRSKDLAAPDFQILFYPVITMDPSFTHHESMTNLLGENPHKKHIRLFSADQQITRLTPRAFIALSDDDQVVLPANAVNYYLECYRHDVPATLHVYPDGGHGWGFKPDFAYHIEMLLDLKAWLESF